VLPRHLPGLFLKTSRGYFRVFADKENIDCVAASQRTLGTQRNYFPIQADPKSWLPLKEGEIRKFGQVFCRLPTGFLTTLRVNDTMQLRPGINMLLVADDGAEIDRFSLDSALASAIDGSLTVRGKNESQIVIRPSLKLDKTLFNLELRPDNLSVRTGSAATLTVGFKNGMEAPFNLEAGVRVQSTSQQVKVPLTLTIPKGQAATELRFTPSGGTGLDRCDTSEVRRRFRGRGPSHD
jgi:hypothetical protein